MILVLQILFTVLALQILLSPVIVIEHHSTLLASLEKFRELLNRVHTSSHGILGLSKSAAADGAVGGPRYEHCVSCLGVHWAVWIIELFIPWGHNVVELYLTGLLEAAIYW